MQSQREKNVESVTWGVLIACLIATQQIYARTHEYGVEQPIGFLGIAEWLYRHPESLFGQHFNYPIVRDIN